MTGAIRTAFDAVTRHNVLVLVLMLLVTAGVAAGTAQLQLGEGESPSGSDSEVAQKMEYVQHNFGNRTGATESARKPAAVYVRSEGNALSKSALLDSLRYQRAVRDNESVAAALGDRRVLGVANLVATRAAGTPDPTLEQQIAALERASESEVEQLVGRTLTPGSPALRLLPETYEPGTTTAESHRMVFPFADTDGRTAATAALYETASERESPEYFTRGEHARDERQSTYLLNTMELVVPAALLVILAVLGFSYRDFVDVAVGFAGVVLSVLWMFGILGWLRIPAGVSIIIGPVLIVGLSVDYGLHVFMRYREQRGEAENVREPMARGLSSVSVALGLVTLTAMLGFMSNATSELTTIRQLAIAITLGVLSTLVVSLTIVPSLKVTVDRLLERAGLDRHTRPLGKTGLLQPMLKGGASLARRGAPVVLVVALVAGSAGAVAWTDLDRQSIQQQQGEIDDWKQDLPGPIGWDVSEASEHRSYVADHYRAADEDRRSRSSVLVEGTVTDPAALESVQAVHGAARESDIVFQRGDAVAVTSPLTVMEDVAASDETFRKRLREADTDGDGLPDRNLEAVYDALYATAPDRASRVLDREDGEYRSLRVIVPVQSDATTSERAAGMRSIAAAGGGDEAVSTTAVGSGILQQVQLSETADSILETLVVALVAVSVLLIVVYRLIAGSASLGAVTALPISLVAALVIGGMWVFDVPLTLLTALLLSLVIGVGVDYNIHVSDRFLQERERGRTVHDALVAATTGTGGALLGSTLTSAGAFSALLLHPNPQFEHFGTLVILAMVTSFIVAVFVLPSLLLLWTRYVRPSTTGAGSGVNHSVRADD
ncbi:efflux RND transporter permease subunit [Natronomonas marina]|uniref:efflux RND transporter permease subunit n=1 Tax=Natronomonas marina TaxID=2961939 RepID=UPI0020C9BA65|nr:MMPL family transporter [Natronomonas marina]